MSWLNGPVGKALPKSVWGAALLCFLCILVACVSTRRGPIPEVAPGMGYTNEYIPEIPWSVHVVSLDRARHDLVSVHAGHTAVGLSPLTRQIESIPSSLGKPVAAINGDFYMLEEYAFAGDPRGMQITEGELISSPNGGAVLWVDATNGLHMTNVSSRFTVTWPDGETNGFGLNESLRTNGMVLYTPAMGWTSTFASNGWEVVMERAGTTNWIPLAPGEIFLARVSSVHFNNNAPITLNSLVMASGPYFTQPLPKVRPGDFVRLSMTTSPDLSGSRTAIGGGPILVRNGRSASPSKPIDMRSMPYRLRSMWERHPRSAVGWNSSTIYLVQVDGRQRLTSAGMTLAELAKYMIQLGCTDAMNLDGGGSATIWYDGKVLNSPSDGEEREIANSLVIVKKP